MSFDNAKFTAWMVDFQRALVECGMPEAQALKFRGEFYSDAVSHFAAGRTPDDAAVREVMGVL